MTAFRTIFKNHLLSPPQIPVYNFALGKLYYTQLQKTIPVLTAKPSALLRRLSAGFTVALPQHPTSSRDRMERLRVNGNACKKGCPKAPLSDPGQVGSGMTSLVLVVLLVAVGTAVRAVLLAVLAVLVLLILLVTVLVLIVLVIIVF